MKTVFASAFAFLLAAGSANATILVANDSFSITSISKSNPNSIKNDAGGDGWAGGWQTQATAANAPQIVSTTSLQGQSALELTKNADKAAFRLLEDAQTGDMLVDFLISVSASPTAYTNAFAGFWLGNIDGPSIGLKSDCGLTKAPAAAAACTDDLFVRTGGTGGVYAKGVSVKANTVYHLFGHLYKTNSSASYNSFDLWVNPTAAEMQSLTGWDAHAVGASNITDFDTVGFRTANLDKTKNIAVRIDALDLSEVPEPATLSLMAVALAGLGLARRKRA